MTIYNDLRQAIEEKLNSISGLPTTGSVKNIAWENYGKYEPKPGDKWIRVTLQPVSQKPAGAGSLAPIFHLGILLLDVFVPEGTGPKEAEQLADTLITEFSVGSSFTKNGETVRVRYSEREAGINEPPWYHIPVNITWYSFVPV